MAEVVLLRHGQTEWSAAGRHTGTTDLPLTAEGESQARAAAALLAGRAFGLVLASPLARARRTAELAGFPAQPDADLVEWDYGDAEGRTTAQMRADTGDPAWTVWTHAAGGEPLAHVAQRAARALDRCAPVLAGGADVLLAAHGHLLRILAAGWMGLPPGAGRLLGLDAGAVCVLGHEHEQPVVRRWNLLP